MIFSWDDIIYEKYQKGYLQKITNNCHVRLSIPVPCIVCDLTKILMEDLIMWQSELYFHRHPKMTSYLLNITVMKVRSKNSNKTIVASHFLSGLTLLL